MSEKIEVIGARCNNLKNLHLTLPLHKLILFEGPSGSGKSSLAIDTILQEGRRHLLSAMGGGVLNSQLNRPDVDAIKGLPPTLGISLESGQRHGPLETLGLLLGISPLVAHYYAKHGILHCPESDLPMPISAGPEIVQRISSEMVGCKIAILAPIVFEMGNYQKILAELEKQGFARLRVNGRIVLIEDAPTKSRGPIELVIDRMRVSPSRKSRLFEAVNNAVAAGGGRLFVLDLDSEEITSYSTQPWSKAMGRFFPKPSPDMMNHRTRNAACLSCVGSGISSDDMPCNDCGGSRLNALGRNIHFDGINYARANLMSIGELAEFLRTDSDSARAEIVRRLEVLIGLGLDRLSLARGIDSLSVGERNRSKLSVLFAERIPHALYVFDEPGLGLDGEDIPSIIDEMRKLISLGSTVIVVDHHPLFAAAADVRICFGPGAGDAGGEVIPKGREVQPLLSPRPLNVPAKSSIKMMPFQRHDFAIPEIRLLAGALNCISGPSGSGKSRIAIDCFGRQLRMQLGLKGSAPICPRPIIGLSNFKKLILIDDSAIVGNKRSCVATKTGIWTVIRELLSKTRESRIHGLEPSYFSFNTKGGRCEACMGLGTIVERIPPLPIQEITCRLCNGDRFDEAALAIRYHGLNPKSILDLEINSARRVFTAHPKLNQILSCMQDVGLGYLKLGQGTATLSGGESRRLVLAMALAASLWKKRRLEDAFIIIDEPTAALHPADIAPIYNILMQLRDKGATLLCVSNQSAILAAADKRIHLRRQE